MNFDHDNIILLDKEHERTVFPLDKLTYVNGDYYVVQLGGSVDRFYPVCLIKDSDPSTPYQPTMRYFTSEGKRHLTYLYFSEMKDAKSFIESRLFYEL